MTLVRSHFLLHPRGFVVTASWGFPFWFMTAAADRDAVIPDLLPSVVLYGEKINVKNSCSCHKFTLTGARVGRERLPFWTTYLVNEFWGHTGRSS